MKDIIEIYIKIVAATFGFIAPSMTFFLGIFAKGKSRQIKRNEEKISELKGLILIPNGANKPSDTQIKEIEKNIKLLKRLQRKAKRDINLLNPFRQFVRIFLLLILCVFFISLYYLFRNSFFVMEMSYYKLCTLFVSFVLFSWSLIAIAQIFKIMIDLKQLEYEEDIDKLDDNNELEIANE